MQFKKMAAVVSSALAVSAGAHAQDAVQWRVEDGGNGHWYGIEIRPSGLTWISARDLSIEVGGQLTSLETTTERDFVLDRFSRVAAPAAWIPQLTNGAIIFGPWIGAAQAAGGTEPNGGWSWLSGVEFDPSWPPSCCNNSCSTPEQYLHLYFSDIVMAHQWNDLPNVVGCGNQPTSFIVEWSADCNSDGIVDYGQIRAGELEDANANNTPDCCEQGVSCPSCPGDVDESGTVNGVDLAAILAVWGSDGGKYPRADTNNDGVVNGSDLATVLGSWGSCE